MVTAIKQLVTVEAGGRIAMQSPELHEGESVEVIVMLQRPGEGTSEQRLIALHQLRQALDLRPAAAARWESDVRAERAAWRNPPTK